MKSVRFIRSINNVMIPFFFARFNSIFRAIPTFYSPFCMYCVRLWERISVFIDKTVCIYTIVGERRCSFQSLVCSFLLSHNFPVFFDSRFFPRRIIRWYVCLYYRIVCKLFANRKKTDGKLVSKRLNGCDFICWQFCISKWIFFMYNCKWGYSKNYLLHWKYKFSIWNNRITAKLSYVGRFLAIW